MFTKEKVIKVVKKEISDYLSEGAGASFYLNDEASEKEMAAFRLGAKTAAQAIRIRLWYAFLRVERRQRIRSLANAMRDLSNDEVMCVLYKVLGDTHGAH